MLASPTVRKKGRRVAVAFAAGSGRRRCWHSSNLVHLQHRNHVDDERIGYGPNRDEDSPIAFSKDCKDEAYSKSANGNAANELPDSGGWHQSVRTTTVMKPRIVENQFQQH